MAASKLERRSDVITVKAGRAFTFGDLVAVAVGAVTAAAAAVEEEDDDDDVGRTAVVAEAVAELEALWLLTAVEVGKPRATSMLRSLLSSRDTWSATALSSARPISQWVRASPFPFTVMTPRGSMMNCDGHDEVTAS